MSIILIRNGVASRIPPTEFALENAMQSQIAANPNVLPLQEIRDGAELVAVARELPVASGYIDLLGFDAEGEIYVIETKLARNPDKRTVVAQTLDYGAALWTGYREPDAFFLAIDALLARDGAPKLANALEVAHGGDASAAAGALERIARNLGNGAFRFVIPMDRIHEGLKDLVRYLNENSRFTIYLVELEQYQDGDLTVVVPRLFGAEARKSVGGASTGVGTRPGSADEFRNEVERRIAAGELDAEAADAVREMLRVVTEYGEGHNWTIGVAGRVSVSPRFPSTGATRSPFTLRSDGRIDLNFGFVANVPAWHGWTSNVASTLGLSGDPRRFPGLKPANWVPHAKAVVALTENVLRGV